jgi:hypothetical protein
VLANGIKLQCEEGFVVHPVRRVDVREELVDDSVREDGYTGIRRREIPEELGGVIDAQLGIGGLALNKYPDLTIFANGVVDLFALLGADVASELGHYLTGIKYIIAKGLKEGHDQRGLGCFFGQQHFAMLSYNLA